MGICASVSSGETEGKDRISEHLKKAQNEGRFTENVINRELIYVVTFCAFL